MADESKTYPGEDVEALRQRVAALEDELAECRRAEQRFHQAQGELEERVQERTAELSRANALLTEEIRERHRVEEALRRSHAECRALLEAVPDMLLRVGKDGTFLESKAARDFAPYVPARDFLGKKIPEVLPPPLAQLCMHHVQQALATGRTQSFEYQLPRADGPRDFEARAIDINDEEVLVVVRDVTEKRRGEERLHKHMTELAHADRINTMGEMASGLAHELNQPLTAISSFIGGSLRRLEAGNFPPAELREVLQDIANQAHRAGEIIRGLRNFVRKREPHRATVQVNDIVREAVGLAGGELEQGGVRLHLDLSPELPVVLADTIQIEQVLLNLVRNAVDALSETEPGQRELTVQTRLAADAQAVEVAVDDCGPGLAPEAAQHLFHPFFTTKPSGLGMGLMISRSIIEAHGGRLWMTINGDRGVTFQFTLPTHVQRSIP
jgi:PAS domain S-box-containing protein